jgi:hypothetical protein
MQQLFVPPSAAARPGRARAAAFAACRTPWWQHPLAQGAAVLCVTTALHRVGLLHDTPLHAATALTCFALLSGSVAHFGDSVAHVGDRFGDSVTRLGDGVASIGAALDGVGAGVNAIGTRCVWHSPGTHFCGVCPNLVAPAAAAVRGRSKPPGRRTRR